MPEFVRSAVLIAATMATGLMAGVFGLYANTIMPGLGRTDDRTFVGAFQSIDKAIINPLFLAIFFGAVLFTGLAAVVHLGKAERAVLPWIVAALLLYLIVLIVTIAVNVPLNDGLKAAGEADRIPDLAAVRQRFNEATWIRWNLFRALLSAVAFGCLTWALVLHGRMTPPGRA
jgi:uncharacterized membrane protein